MQGIILEGIRQGREEIKLAKDAAQELRDGLKLLKELSGGIIGYNSQKAIRSSDLEFIVTSLPPVFLKVTAAGIMTVSRDPAYNDAYELDAMKEGQVAGFLRDLAKAAALVGHLPLAEGPQMEPANAGERAVLEGLRQASQEKTLARVAAEDIITALRTLQNRPGSNFTFEEDPYAGSNEVVLVLNHDKPSASVIVVNNDGKIKIDNKEYDAFIPEERDAALARITRKALFQGHINPSAKNPRP